MPLTQAELDLIKPHLSKENVEKATLENGLSLLTDQMKALSTLAIEQASELKKAEGKALDRLEIDADTLETSVELVQTKLDGLVASGEITPAVQKALSNVLIGPESARNVYALSRKATGGAKSIATQVIDALKGNKPVKLTEKTAGQQKIELSRTDDQAEEAFGKKANEIMTGAANRGR